MRRLAVAILLATAVHADPSTGRRLAEAARAQVGVTRIYDSSYVRLRYPGGDVPRDRGVCSDVVVRAFRSVGVDLQVAVHEDMRASFNTYPRMWGLSGPDANIDHRRVPNLMKFLQRRGRARPLTAPYEAGDVVAWMLPNGLYHIGIVSSVPGQRDLEVVHNIGYGARSEDVLRSFRIIGHYRW